MTGLEWIEHPAFTQRLLNAAGELEETEVEQSWSCQCSPAILCWAWANGDWRVQWRMVNQRAVPSPCERGGKAANLREAQAKALEAAEHLLIAALLALQFARSATEEEGAT